MSGEVRTVGQIFDGSGRLSDMKEVEVPVQFDMIETQDFYLNMPGFWFAYGNLRINPGLEPDTIVKLRSASELLLKANDFEAIIHWYDNEFTVVQMLPDRRQSVQNGPPGPSPEPESLQFADL